MELTQISLDDLADIRHPEVGVGVGVIWRRRVAGVLFTLLEDGRLLADAACGEVAVISP